MRALGGWTQRLLIAQALCCALAIMLALQFVPGFDDADGSRAYALVLLLQSVLFIATSILFLRWTYRASAHVHARGAQGLIASPGWAVGWYFVPLACLGMPLQALREIWKASIRPGDWEIVRATPLLGWWWLFWLLSSFASIIGWRLDTDERMTAAASWADRFSIVSDALLLCASLLLAIIVGRLTRIQSVKQSPAFEA